jgi:molybdopterin-guanine dinucleotide biosynthesis protein A
MILGAVLAGGQSSRFGSDKALAEFRGHTLLAHAVDTLSGWCEHVIVVGRPTAPAPTLPDWPRAGMGPLGGIAAALHHARDENYEFLLTCGVDSIALPEDLPDLLTPAPAFLASQPIIGLWSVLGPSSAIGPIEDILHGDGPHSLKRFTQAIGARAVKSPVDPANINTQADLAALEAGPGERGHGL